MLLSRLHNSIFHRPSQKPNVYMFLEQSHIDLVANKSTNNTDNTHFWEVKSKTSNVVGSCYQSYFFSNAISQNRSLSLVSLLHESLQLGYYSLRHRTHLNTIELYDSRMITIIIIVFKIAGRQASSVVCSKWWKWHLTTRDSSHTIIKSSVNY